MSVADTQPNLPTLKTQDLPTLAAGPPPAAPEVRAYAEWWAWAKAKGCRPIQCHLAAQAAMDAMAHGADAQKAIAAATAATQHEELFRGVEPDRAAYAAWYSTGADLGLDRDRAHLFAQTGVHATDAGEDIKAATAAAEAAAGLREASAPAAAPPAARPRSRAPMIAAALVVLVLAGAVLAWVTLRKPSDNAPSASTRTAHSIALQPSDVPAGLVRCPQSGDMASYVAALQGAGTASATGNAQLTVRVWQQLQSEGATAADLEVFTDSQATCAAYLAGATTTGRLVVGLTYQFKDAASALAVYNSGELTYGVVKPDKEKGQPGVTEGTATGMGANSLVVDPGASGGFILGLWQQGTFTEFFEATGVAHADAQKALRAMYSRSA